VLALVFLKERLSRFQWLAIACAATGTGYLAWYLGATPWVPLALAVTFGFYGLVRKKLNAGPMIGLLWETILLSPLAIVYLTWWVAPADHHFFNDGTGISLLLVGAGVVTVLPLVWFNMAAKRLTLTTIGFMQYIGPSISFLTAVFLFDEVFTPGHMVTFTLIWIALALVSVEPFFRARRIRMPV